MSELISLVIYAVVFWGIISAVKKRKGGMFGPVSGANQKNIPGTTAGGAHETYSGSRTHSTGGGAMPHKHETAKYHNRESGTIPHSHAEKKFHSVESGSMFRRRENGKFHSTESGSMAHDKESGRYRSMADASQLPPGYILLNGEPVRVADLEDK